MYIKLPIISRSCNKVTITDKHTYPISKKSLLKNLTKSPSTYHEYKHIA